MSYIKSTMKTSEWRQIADMRPKDIVEKYSICLTTAYDWRISARRDFGLPNEKLKRVAGEWNDVPQRARGTRRGYIAPRVHQ